MFSMTERLVAAAIALAGILAPGALAIQITKPLANETVLEQNKPEGCDITIAGHYATAAGTTYPYVWSTIPANKAYFDYTPDPQYKHKVRIMSKEGMSCTPYFLKVFDTGDLSSHVIQVNPMKLSWKDNQLVPNDDRVVGFQKPGDEIRTREIQFDVTGAGNISHELRIRTWKHNLPSTGKINVLAYDGHTDWIQELGACSGAGGAATREWRVVLMPVSGGCLPPATHTLTIQGDDRSSVYEDIEIDTLAWHQASVDCYDGIGATMLYTVPEIDLESFGLSEATEYLPGKCLYRPKQGTGRTDTVGVAKLVFPDSMPGYDLRVERLSPPVPPRIRLEKEDQSAFAFENRAINAALPFTFWINPIAKSEWESDSVVRAYLVRSGTNIERGGETCRDDIGLTAVEIEIICPTSPPFLTPGSSSANGNEWAFDSSGSGVMAIDFRATALPDTAAVQSELVNRIEFRFLPTSPISGSTLTWDSASSDGGWASPASGSSLPDRWQARATFTGLPSNNSDFGIKSYWMVLHQPDDQSIVFSFGDIRSTEVFFERDATNHPGGTSMNFYYYWTQTSATFGSSHQWGSASMTGWDGGVLKMFIGPDAIDSGPPGWNNSPEGIDSLAWTIRHEDCHFSSLSSQWPSSLYVAANDPDGDLQTTTWENATTISWQPNLTIGGVSASHYDPNLQSTVGLIDLGGYGAGFCDPEDWAMQTQATWTNGSADSVDWAKPGKQYGH